MELNASGTSNRSNGGSSASNPRTNGRSQKPTREEELRRQITRLMNKEKKDSRRNETNDNKIRKSNASVPIDVVIDTNNASSKHTPSTEFSSDLKKSTNKLSEPERTAPDLNEDDTLSPDNENDDVLKHFTQANNTIKPYSASLSPIIEEGTTSAHVARMKSSLGRKQQSKGKHAAADNYARYLALEDDIIGESNDYDADDGDGSEGAATGKEQTSSTANSTPPSNFIPSSSSTPKVSLKSTPFQPSRNLPGDVKNDVGNTLELAVLVQKLEKRIKVLEADKQSLTIKNEKMETLHKPLEEKVVKLKRRNTELASIAKRLEEKAKELQRNGKSRNDSSKQSSQDLDHYKRVFARQRAKDLADHAQKLLAKDKEISDLRQAIDRLQNSSRQPDPNVRNSKMYSEKAELEGIIRQHAKEQLRLQRCLSVASAHDPSGNTIGYQALEETNKALRKELNNLEQSNIQTQQLEVEVAQQRLECDNLLKEIDNEHKRSSVLSTELQNALVQNTELTRQNSQLQERLTQVETFEVECGRLSKALKQQQSLYEASVDERNKLNETVTKLEDEVKLMQAAAEKRKQLEKEHEEAILSLQFKQNEIRHLQKEQQQSKKEHRDSVSKLEDKVKQLEKRYEEQSANVGKLTQELQNLRQVTNKTMEEIAVQTQEKELSKTIEIPKAYASSVSSPNQSKDWLDEYEVIMVNEYAFVSMNGTPLALRDFQMSSGTQLSLNGTPLALRDFEISDDQLQQVCHLQQSRMKEDTGSIGTDLSSYCEKIRRLTLSDSEDNWGSGLGETLNKQSKNAVNGSLSDHALEDGLIADRIMALADSNADISLSQMEAFTDTSESETASLEQMSSHSKDAGLQGLEAQYYEALLNASSEDDGLIESLSNGLKAQATRSVEKSEHFSQMSSSSAMSDEVFQNSEDLSKSGSLLSDSRAQRVSNRKTKESDDVDVSMLQRLQSASVNKLAVFIARYNYTPSSESPNENPDAELPLKAGEYIYVYGDADEDGFYEGELMSGERGLVPGNFIERIADAKDLLDSPDPMLQFQGIVHDSLSDSLNSDEDDARDDDFDRDSLLSYHGMEKDSLSSFPNLGSRESLKDDLNSQLRDLDFNSSEEEAINKAKYNQHPQHNDPHGLARSDHHGSDLEDIIEVDEDENDNSLFSISEIGNDLNGIPPPLNLTLERQFPTSIIISWSHPSNCHLSTIREYKIYINGVPKTTVQAKVKTMLLDFIDQDMTYRIAVRTVTTEGMSDEAACTIMIGKGASASPTRLKASHVTPDTADITWLPGNSNHSHIISVNGREMMTVKPGRHQYSFAGLSPSTVYRVRVTAKPKHIRNENLKRHSAEIEFKTLPGGLPEPPLDVQIKPGNQPGTLVVEWLPVTITTSGLSNGAVVMGYTVYANEYKVASTDSPTVDRLVLNVDKLRALGANHIVVRTLSPDGFSSDSSKVHLPQHLLQTSTPTTQQSEMIRARGNMYDNASDDDSQSSRTTSEDSHPDVFAKNGAVKMVNSSPPTTNDVKRKPECQPLDNQSESDRSELSDIAEEVEEELSDFESGDLPGLSDSLNKNWRNEQFKNVKDTLEHNAKLESEFDETDPEVEQLNKPNHAVPIQIIRQQRDYERESDLSPHNQVLEPVPVKPKQADLQMSVPQIEITKDSASDVVTSSMSEQYSDHEFDHPRNGAAAANPSMRENAQTRKQSLDSGSEWEDSRKDYDSKNNNKQSLGKSQKSSQDTYSTDPEELYDDSTIRMFVALYDYDPESMSPNDDGMDEELAFREGDIIKVFGDRDADGFYIGELNGKRGFVPYNMIQETLNNSQVPQANQSHDQSSEPINTTGELNRTEADTPQGYQSPVNGHQSSSSQKEVERCMLMRAVFDYDPSVLSPNPDIENELSFQQGDLINVFGDMDEDGFFMGELNGGRGLVPSNFLEEASDPGLNGSAGSPAPSTGGYSLNSFDRSPTTKDSQQDLGRRSSIGSSISKQSNGFDQLSQTSVDDPKKKKGLLSKGKALFKKFGGGGDSGKQKKK